MRNILLQGVLVFVLSLVCFVLQTTALQHISLADVVPNLMLILVVSLAYIKGNNMGMLAGIICGLLSDFIFGGLIGINSLIGLIIGYLAGFSHKIYSPEDVTFPVLITAAADFLYGVLYFILHFLFRNRLHFSYYLRRIILPEVVYTVVVSAIIYKVVQQMFLSAERKKK